MAWGLVARMFRYPGHVNPIYQREDYLHIAPCPLGIEAVMPKFLTGETKQSLHWILRVTIRRITMPMDNFSSMTSPT